MKNKKYLAERKMGCYKLTYDYEPTLFLQEQGEKNYSLDWRITVNAGSKLGGEGAKVLLTGIH